MLWWVEKILSGSVFDKPAEVGDINVQVLWDPKFDAAEGINNGFDFITGVLTFTFEIPNNRFPFFTTLTVVVTSLWPTALL